MRNYLMTFPGAPWTECREGHAAVPHLNRLRLPGVLCSFVPPEASDQSP
jgi:hypothetical protein